MRMRPSGVLLCLGIVSAGCAGSGDAASQPRAAVRDSAGVTIVENERPAPDSRLDWTVGTAPSVSIGVVEGDPNYQLFRVTGATRLSDGRIVVANGGTSELKVFDGDGSYLAAWGGSGEGPGEFGAMAPSGLAPWPGDSVMGAGSFQRRISVFDSGGNHGRTFNLGDGYGSVVAVVPDESGPKMIATTLSTFGARTEGARVELQRLDMPYAALNADGSLDATLVTHPGTEWYVFWNERGFPVRARPHPFGRSISEARWGDLVVISPNDRYEILAYRADGSLARIVRRDHESRTPTQADLDDHFARLYADEPDEERAESLAAVQGLPQVEAFPAFGEVVADRMGYLWVSEYQLPGQELGNLWTIFDPEGRVLGLVEAPDIEIRDIGEDYILGTTSDEVGVEYVQVWSLARTPS